MSNFTQTGFAVEAMARTFMPQYQNLWDFNFIDLTAVPLSYLIESMTLPFPSIEVEERKNGSVHPRGIKHESDFTITFRETSLNYVQAYFRLWQGQIYDSKSRQFTYNSSAKRNAILRFESPMAVNSVLPGLPNLPSRRPIMFEGILFKGISDQTLSYESGEGMKITCNFSVDKVYITLEEELAKLTHNIISLKDKFLQRNATALPEEINEAL